MEFINNFPFSIEARRYLQDQNIDITTLPTDYPEMFEEAFSRLQTLIEANMIPTEVDTTTAFNEVLIYAIMRIFIEVLNESFLLNRIAVAYSKRTQTILQQEPPQIITQLANNTFKWDLQRIDPSRLEVEGWRIHFTNFLEISPDFFSSEWKLINQFIWRGWVLLHQQKIIRLIAEMTKKYILRRGIGRGELPSLPPIYFQYTTILKTQLEKVRKEGTFPQEIPAGILETAYPPCIVAILKKASEGENLAHTERLQLTFFMLTIGMEPEKVIDLFRSQPDFKEDRTRYQVNFAAGKRGSGTKYSPYGCDKSISFGICKRELDTRGWCQPRMIFKRPLTNPIQYYRTVVFLESRKSQEVGPH
jgi:DNA primase large subunit